MGLQWLIVEKKALLYNSQKHGFFTSVKHRFTLCPVDTQRKTKWRLPVNARKHPHYTDKKAAKGEGFSESFLIFLQKNGQHKCQPFTIPTFQALNVRFSVKIFAIFLSQRKNKPQCPDEWA